MSGLSLFVKKISFATIERKCIFCIHSIVHTLRSCPISALTQETIIFYLIFHQIYILTLGFYPSSQYPFFLSLISKLISENMFVFTLLSTSSPKCFISCSSVSVMTFGSSCDKIMSSTYHTSVNYFPSIILLATHLSYGFISKPTPLRFLCILVKTQYHTGMVCR